MVHKNHLRSWALEFPLPLWCVKLERSQCWKEEPIIKVEYIEWSNLDIKHSGYEGSQPANSIWQVVQFDTDVSQQ